MTGPPNVAATAYAIHFEMPDVVDKPREKRIMRKRATLL